MGRSSAKKDRTAGSVFSRSDSSSDRTSSGKGTGGIGSCTDGCYRIKYDVSNFQDGNYSVTCRWSNDYNVGTANINNNNVNDNSAWCGVEGSEGLPTIILNGPSGRVTS